MFQKFAEDQVPMANQPKSSLEVYLLYAYCLLICPFRLVPGSPGISTWRLQKLLCGLCLLLSVPWMIFQVRQDYPTVRTVHNPHIYFTLVYSICTLTIKLLLAKNFWCNQNALIDIVSYLRENVFLHTPQRMHYSTKATSLLSLTTRKSAMHLLMLIFILLTVFYVKTGYGIVEYDMKFNTLNDSSLHALICESTKQVYFLDVDLKCFAVECSWNSWSNLDTVLTVLGYIGHIHFNIFIFVPHILILVCTKTLWIATSNFALELEHVNFAGWAVGRENQWRRIYSQYTAIQHLSRLLNKVIGTCMAWHLVEITVYYATTVERMFSQTILTGEWTNFVTVLGPFLMTFSIVFYSADSSHKMGKFVEWLGREENQDVIPVYKLNVLLNDLKSHDSVGIKAGGIFTVTYTLIANLIGLTVTYFIICLER